MQGAILYSFIVVLLITLVRGNVEKVVFVVPAHAQALVIPSSEYLEQLSPAQPSLRRRLHARFPLSRVSSEPSDAWIHLSGLQPGTRYEVRICWSATQPTDFTLSIRNEAEVSSDKILRQSMRSYLDARRKVKVKKQSPGSMKPESSTSSQLLHVTAAADYFSNNRTLMRDGLLVDVEIILDPFLFNVFPQSLLPTAAYLICIAIGAWFLSNKVAELISAAASPRAQPPSATKKKTLPNEVLLVIIEEIPILFCCALVVAAAPSLLRRGMISGITRREVLAMQRLAFYGFAPEVGRRPSDATEDYFQKLPSELWFMIGDRLKPEDKLNFAVATWQSLVREWDARAVRRQA